EKPEVSTEVIGKPEITKPQKNTDTYLPATGGLANDYLIIIGFFLMGASLFMFSVATRRN
ncbi:TPA: LPXTG cell wall anchor domain-containing protein, partial [Bacillus cereus]|nr:LPXTG cell wall anchor domain-containing protein [Bacillus cereus]